MVVNGAKTYQFKEKDSKLNAYTLCLGNIWKYFIVRHEYDFSVDYDSINFYDILDFHKYLTKKQDIR